MALKTNEKKATVIDISSTDQTVNFNSLFITTAGSLVYTDATGASITVPGTVPVGKFEAQGRGITKSGTTITGIALSDE
jgi:hypothetical protein